MQVPAARGITEFPEILQIPTELASTLSIGWLLTNARTRSLLEDTKLLGVPLVPS